MSAERPSSGAYRSQDYAPDLERTYHVCVLIGPDSSAWSAHGERLGHVVAMAWAPGAEALQHRDLPRAPRSVTYVPLPQWSTLVPDGALEPGTTADHLKLVHDALPTSEVREAPIATLGAQCLYTCNADHERTLLDRYAFARSLPLQAVLVNSVRERSSAGPVLLLHRGAERIDVAIADRGSLLLSTSYPARTPEDVLYFCLLATERTALAPTTIAVRSGGTHITPADRDLLSRYFADAGPALAISINGPMPPSIEMDRWLAVFDQCTCVS